jgi:hypothetical protein
MMEKQMPGNRSAVMTIVLIQFCNHVLAHARVTDDFCSQEGKRERERIFSYLNISRTVLTTLKYQMHNSQTI